MSALVLTPSLFRAHLDSDRVVENAHRHPQLRTDSLPLGKAARPAPTHPIVNEPPIVIAKALEARQWVFILLHLGCYQLICESPFLLTPAGVSPSSRYVSGGRVTLELFSPTYYGLLPQRKTDVLFRRLEKHGDLPELPVSISQQEIPDGWWGE